MFVDFLMLFFLYLLYFPITMPYLTLLLIVNPHAIPVDIGITIKPFPVRDNVKELDFVAKITIVSNDSNIVVNISIFLHFFHFVILIFEKSNHFHKVKD